MIRSRRCLPTALPVLILLAACGTSVVEPGDAGTTTTTTSTPHIPACGDGTLDPGEACDDGNTWDGDYCSPDCMQVAPCNEPEVTDGYGPQHTIPAVSDYLTWCTRGLLFAEKNSASIVHLDVLASEAQAKYPLLAEPGRLVIDPLRAHLFVAEPSAAQIERVDLGSGATLAIPLPAAPIGLALGKGGRVFAVMDDPEIAPKRAVALVDGTAGVVDGVIVDNFGDLVVYDRAHDQLITGDDGTPAGALRRFAYDAQAKTLAFVQELPNAGKDCRDLLVSPDGQRLVYLCAGGNTGVDGVADFSTADLTVVQGVWASDYHPELQLDPRGGAFRSDGRGLLVAGGTKYAIILTDAYEGEGAGAAVGVQPDWVHRSVRLTALPGKHGGWAAYTLDANAAGAPAFQEWHEASTYYWW